jgi:hypothetical protein
MTNNRYWYFITFFSVIITTLLTMINQGFLVLLLGSIFFWGYFSHALAKEEENEFH